MGRDSKIQWTDRVTWNPLENPGEPLRWRKPRLVEVAEMFGGGTPLVHIIDAFANTLIFSQHTFMVPTAHPDRLCRLFNLTRWKAYGPNVWIGLKASTQADLDRGVPNLLRIPAAVRFLSLEPLVEAIRLPTCPHGTIASSPGFRIGMPYAACGDSDGIGWVICGGESGPKARPMHPAWVRSIRDQCVAAGVPFHFKQWGEWVPGNAGPGGDLYKRDRVGIESGFFTYGNAWIPGGPNPFRQTMDRTGKASSGRLLDDREWDEMPNTNRENQP